MTVREYEIIIVGGGLVGSLLATQLVRRGHRVGVYEKRPDMRSEDAVAGRSINLVATERGIRALRYLGLEEPVLATTVPVRGRMMHAVDGQLTYQPYGKDDSEMNYSVSRGKLNQLLISQAEQAGAEFHFAHPMVGADFATGQLEFADESGGGTVSARAERVFGADGAGSQVRTEMMKLPGFEESLTDLGHGYKELEIPAGDGGAFRIEENALHIWPRGQHMMMALPNQDGSFTVTLYLPEEGPLSFASLQSPGQVSRFFEEYFPDSIPLLPSLEADYFANPNGYLGTLRCSPWNLDGRVALIGDAAHAIVPFFGQGMNCGFEDCMILEGLLDRHDGDWDTVFAGYTAERKPNGDAIAAMAIENFLEMRDRVADPEFLLRKKVEHRLENELPGEYRTRYSAVVYSSIPYHLCQEAGLLQAAILDELCSGLADAQDLDLGRAQALIQEHLTPFLAQHGIRLDY